MRRHRLLACAVVLLCLAAMFQPAAARGPDLRLRPNDGEVSETVTSRGKGFASGELVHLWWS